MRFYAGKITQSGVVQREFVPVRRCSDKAVGLLDLVAYRQDSTTGFYANKGTGVFTAGEATGCIYVDGDTVYLPTTATWTNLTGDGDPANSANWACTNSIGEMIASALPTNVTVVTIPNGCTNNFPASSPLVVKEVKLPATLGADNLDWSGIVAPFSGTLDLQGKKLTVSQLAGSGTITDSTDLTADATGTPGELHVNVAAGTTNVNATVALCGNMKLVKEGTGAFTATKVGQSYAGGTEVAAGLLSLPANNTSATGCLGATSGTVRVDANATLELNGSIGFNAYSLVLAGGDVRNTSGESTYSKQTATLGRVTLEADSTVTPKVSISHTGLVDLNEHMLTVRLASGQNYTLKGAANFTNGTVKVTTGGWFRALDNPRDMRTANLYIGAGVALDKDIQVNDLWLFRRDNSATGNGGFRIYGTYKTEHTTPGYYNIFHRKCEMQDGSSLDLSTLTSAWPIEPYSTFSNCDKLAFAKNATVTVLLGNRKPKDNEQIVSWLSNNAPDTTVEFVLEPGRSARLIRKTDGLWLKNGFLIRIR